jgi:hypothetical protein
VAARALPFEKAGTLAFGRHIELEAAMGNNRPHLERGRSSGVEHNLAKVRVGRSIRLARSKFLQLKSASQQAAERASDMRWKEPARLTTALCAAAVSLHAGKQPHAPAAAPTAAPKMLPAQAYGFRGMRLGTSLADFRKAPFPEAGGTASVVCSSDPDASKVTGSIDLNPLQKAAGVVVCGYFTKDPKAPDRLQSAAVTVGPAGQPATELTYNFVPDPVDGTPKLYLISAVTAAVRLKQVLSDLEAEYGPGSSHTEEAIEPPMGTPYTEIIATWANPISGITVQTPFYGRANLGILYTENRLADVVALTKVRRPGAK